MGKAGRMLRTVLNKEQYENFVKWRNEKGIESDYAALKYLATHGISQGVTFGEPASVVKAMENRANEIQEMTPKQAKTELQKWLENRKGRADIAKRSLFAPDAYDSLLGYLFEKREPPTAAMYFLMEFWNDFLLAQRSMGHDVRTVVSDFLHNHFAQGDFRRNRKNKFGVTPGSVELLGKAATRRNSDHKVFKGGRR